MPYTAKFHYKKTLTSSEQGKICLVPVSRKSNTGTNIFVFKAWIRQKGNMVGGIEPKKNHFLDQNY